MQEKEKKEEEAAEEGNTSDAQDRNVRMNSAAKFYKLVAILLCCEGEQRSTWGRESVTEKALVSRVLDSGTNSVSGNARGPLLSGGSGDFDLASRDYRNDKREA